MKHSLLILIIVLNILTGAAETNPLTSKDSIDVFTLTQWCAFRNVGQQVPSTEKVSKQTRTKNWLFYKLISVHY